MIKHAHLLLGSLFIALGLALFSSHSAFAVSFDPSHIVDDLVFYNSNSMSVQDIQNFLNAKMPSCDTNGALSVSYNYSVSTGAVGKAATQSDVTYVTTTRAIFGQRYDSYNTTTIGATPYVCLNQYAENPTTHQNNLQGASVSGAESAAQIIYNAAQTYSINPQVLLVTLQKEQSLVTDDWPWVNEYQEAMGYVCPDTPQGCNSAYSGFYKQVTDAAWQLREYATHPNNFNYVPGPGNNVYYNPNVACGYTTLNIQNQATASLYIYTPYQPNTAALSGSGDGCSAYGNLNFFNYFTSWFGTTYNPFYAWQLGSEEAYSDSARTIRIDTNTISPNQVIYMRIVARNMGNITWTNSGTNSVNFGTSSPQNRNSIFCDNTWLSCDRPATLKETSVASGQLGTFEFEMKAPSSYGTYAEHFNVVVEGKTWLNDIGMYMPFGVKPPTYSWQYEGQGLFSDPAHTIPINNNALSPNTTYYLTVNAQNNGNTTWSNSGINPLDLGTSALQDRVSQSCDGTWLSCNRPARLSQTTVSPGQTGTFNFEIRTPSSYGLYNEHFAPVVEGLLWMNDNGLYWPLNVSAPIALWQYQGQSAYTDSTMSTPLNLGNSTITNASHYYVVLKALNTGNTTWSNSGTNPVDLGTSHSQDRTSQFCDSTWISCNRAARLTEPSVVPGQVGTFSFWMQAPYEINGTSLSEYFKPVVENSMWMNDLGQFLPATFQTSTSAWQYLGQGTYTNSTYTTSVNPSNATINTIYYLELKAKNTGGTTWSNTGTNPLDLGTSNPRDRTSKLCNNTWISCNRAARLVETSVAPGQTGTFRFSVTTPATAGTYNEYFEPVIEGATWLTDVGLYWGFTVN